MRRSFRFVVLSLLLAGVTLGPASAKSPGQKLEAAGDVLDELLNAPDGGVPQGLLEGAECVIAIPHVIKVAFVWGGRRGRGVVSCRSAKGDWSPPSFVNITGGSFGLQIGGQATDLVLFVMNPRGAKAIMKSKFTLGADASAAAGPVGRHAEAGTDITFRSGVYVYARSKGLFAGLALEGAVLSKADKMIKKAYGQDLDPEDILFRHAVPSMPDGAGAFLGMLPRAAAEVTP